MASRTQAKEYTHGGIGWTGTSRRNDSAYFVRRVVLFGQFKRFHQEVLLEGKDIGDDPCGAVLLFYLQR